MPAPTGPRVERKVPDPPLLVRGGGIITTVHVWARLRGNGAMAFDLGTVTLAITGRLRVFTLEPLRLLIALGVAFVGLAVGGALLGPWLGDQLRGFGSHPVLPAIATALGALLLMVPALVAAVLVLSVQAERFDLPVMALRTARTETDRLVLTLESGTELVFRCLPNQTRQMDELADALTRTTGAVRDGLDAVAGGSTATVGSDTPSGSVHPSGDDTGAPTSEPATTTHTPTEDATSG